MAIHWLLEQVRSYKQTSQDSFGGGQVNTGFQVVVWVEHVPLPTLLKGLLVWVLPI